MSNTEGKSEVKRPGAAAGPRRARRALIFCLLPVAFALGACRQDMQDTPRYEAYEAGSEKFSERGAASRTLVEGTVPRGFLREDALLYTGRAGGAQMSGAGGAAQAGGAGAGQGAGAAQGLAGALTQGSGEGSVPGAVNVRGNVGGGVPGAGAAAAGPDVFPFAVDEAALRRGRDRFEAFCVMCHGGGGDGDGMIPRRGFQRPPSFHEDRLQEGSADAAHFFDVISNGWGAMPAYAYMIPAEDRWKIIAYVRALQLSRRLNQGELTEDERAKVASGYTTGAGGGAGEHQRPEHGGRARPEVDEERH